MAIDELEVSDIILDTWVSKNHAPNDARILLQTAEHKAGKWERMGEVISSEGTFVHDDVEDRRLRAVHAARDENKSLRAVLAYRSAARNGAGRPSHIDVHVLHESSRIELDTSDHEIDDEVREAARSSARTIRHLRNLSEEIAELVVSQRDGIAVLAAAQRAAVAEVFPWQTQVTQILCEYAPSLAPLGAVIAREFSAGLSAGLTPEAVTAAFNSKTAQELARDPDKLAQIVAIIRGAGSSSEFH